MQNNRLIAYKNVLRFHQQHCSKAISLNTHTIMIDIHVLFCINPSLNWRFFLSRIVFSCLFWHIRAKKKRWMISVKHWIIWNSEFLVNNRTLTINHQSFQPANRQAGRQAAAFSKCKKKTSGNTSLQLSFMLFSHARESAHTQTHT